MSREWIHASRDSKEYKDGVDEFLQFAVRHETDSRLWLFCPCRFCGNGARKCVEEVKNDLFFNGWDQSYKRWIYHGETECFAMGDQGVEADDDHDGDRLDDMLNAIEESFFDNPSAYDQLLSDAEKPLYDGCSKFTLLSAVLKLFNLKAAYGWSDKSFTCLLELLIEMLPMDNILPKTTYEAKKTLCTMGLTYEKIHACPNDCILYRGEHASLDRCPDPKCGAMRYNKNGGPAKVVRYFPIIPRFKRLYGYNEDAKHLKWHEEDRIRDGKLRHPADSPQWKSIDVKFPDFGCESRNLRLALYTDGMNPHGSMSSSYSTWPVLLAIYNLPPWLCMKRKYLHLSLLISGPRQPGNDIDVYLAPLIEDLKLLWDEGVEVFDADRNEKFRMRAMLFCTINDFPAYGNVSGYSVKGHYACPLCQESTCFYQLEHSRKTVYLGHRRFLPAEHQYRRLRKAFNGQPEHRERPPTIFGEQIFDKLKDIHVKPGKMNKKEIPTTGWKRRSKLYELPYWKFLYVRHCLDVMHIEKNVCDSFIGTLLSVPGKTKDGVNSRNDLVAMGIRDELAPVKSGTRTFLPPASHTLTRREKMAFCEFLRNVKVPDGHCSNFRNIVSMTDLKLVGLKSHDCHILMQQLLPIAVRDILPRGLRNAIIRLCMFFSAICNKVIDPEDLSSLQSEIVVTLCQLEMYFPPSFFDIMVHLTVHLVNEVKFCGPVYLRWMYPFERHMKVLKGYVKNRSRPEGCIAERYIAEEAAEFCANYLSGVDAIGIPKSKHNDPSIGEGIVGERMTSIPHDMKNTAHLYILMNEPEAQPYVDEHLRKVRRDNRGKRETWIIQEHNRCFADWFKKRIGEQVNLDEQSVSLRLRWLSYGPWNEVFSFKGYRINGYTFYTKEQDEKSVVQNSGVAVAADSMCVASAKDSNPIYASIQYYGVIREIWELDYGKFRETVFLCDWADSNSGVEVDEYGATLVDFSRLGHKEEPFILAKQARQVFYVCDPKDNKRFVALIGKNRYVNEGEDGYDIVQESPISRAPPPDDVQPEEGVYARDDHDEGQWIEKKKKNRSKLKRSRKHRLI